MAFLVVALAVAFLVVAASEPAMVILFFLAWYISFLCLKMSLVAVFSGLISSAKQKDNNGEQKGRKDGNGWGEEVFDGRWRQRSSSSSSSSS